MNSKISVYITSYNQEKYLSTAIDSVLSQTLIPLEILIIDDASMDNSKDIILNYKRKYPNLIKVIFNKKNLGISSCRNIGLKNLKGDYLTYLDGDDFFDKQKLQKEYSAILESNSDLAFSNFSFVNENGLVCKKWVPDNDDNLCALEKALQRGYPSGALFRNELISKRVAEEYCYDQNLNIYEDYDFKLKVLKKYNPVHINYNGSYYRQHDIGLSKSPKMVHLKSLRYIYQNTLNSLEDSIENKSERGKSLIKITRNQLASINYSLSQKDRNLLRKCFYIVQVLCYKFL